MFVCVSGVEHLNGTMLNRVLTVECLASSALSFSKAAQILPESPSLDDNKDSPAGRNIFPKAKPNAGRTPTQSPYTHTTPEA